jgi:hypothetical protein
MLLQADVEAPAIKPTGIIDYRRYRRVPGPIVYTFAAAGGWIRQYNLRKRPIRRSIKKRRAS